jgi:hypothetical protein
MNRFTVFSLLLSLWGAWNWYSHRPVKGPKGMDIVNNAPFQTNTDADEFDYKNYRIKPMADFSISARVLSRADYSLDREADLVPTDLALGWGRMADDGVINQLEISQSGRFYFWRYHNPPPIPPQEIIRSSANMHLIPADTAIENAIDSIHPGQIVRFEGYLVNAVTKNGWEWRSSLTREDTGRGACELVWVKSLQIE